MDEGRGGGDGECAENLNDASNNEMNKTINNQTVSFVQFFFSFLSSI